jgi:hypothetical protein
MTKRTRIIILGTALAACVLPAIAQTTNASGDHKPATVQPRKENQQDRIAQGVKSGQLTAAESSHLENREAGVNREIRKDRAANGGKLTGAEKAQINRQQNKLSKQIYRDKHNGRRQ